MLSLSSSLILHFFTNKSIVFDSSLSHREPIVNLETKLVMVIHNVSSLIPKKKFIPYTLWYISVYTAYSTNTRNCLTSLSSGLMETGKLEIDGLQLLEYLYQNDLESVL